VNHPLKAQKTIDILQATCREQQLKAEQLSNTKELLEREISRGISIKNEEEGLTLLELIAKLKLVHNTNDNKADTLITLNELEAIEGSVVKSNGYLEAVEKTQFKVDSLHQLKSRLTAALSERGITYEKV